MVSMEASREVEAARKRLAAARAQKSSACRMIAAADCMAKAAEKNKREAQALVEAANAMAEAARKMMETAKKNKEEAQSMETTAKENKQEAQSFLQSSRNEVVEAEKLLREAEKRWEVIEVVDSGSESEEAGRRNKKRKLVPAAEAAVQLSAAAGAGFSGDATGVEEVVVEGAGTPEVNGTYRRCRTDGRSDAFPVCYDSDFPVYSKGGLWRGRKVNFFLYPSRYNGWDGTYIACEAENHDDHDSYFYCSDQTPSNNLPPKAGWAPILDGTHPAPRLQW